LATGRRTIPLGDGDAPKLNPLTETGGSSVQEKEKRGWTKSSQGSTSK
jgi:hypothetical protein